MLSVLGHTAAGGGWYKVRGATSTGWISDSSVFSAPGRFAAYASASFDVLYPAGWSEAGTPGRGVTFQAPSTPDKVVVTVSPSVSSLPLTAQGAGTALTGVSEVLACGVTTRLSTFSAPGPLKVLAEMAIAVGPHRALGLEAHLVSSAGLSTVLEMVHSLSFPAPACVGGPKATKPTAAPTSPSGHRATTTAAPVPSTAPRSGASTASTTTPTSKTVKGRATSTT